MVEDVLEKLKTSLWRFRICQIDHHRGIRNGYPEVIYCEGKSLEHIQGIVKHMLKEKRKYTRD